MPITIGIPFYNAEATIIKSIRSVYAQTFHEWELLLVDDGSIDRSHEIVRSIKDKRVRIISDGENKKLPARLNQIVDEANYDIVARMDADDMMAPNRLMKQINVLKNKKVSIVMTGMMMLSKGFNPIGYRTGIPRIDMRSLLRGNGIAHAPIMGRIEWFKRNRYKENYSRAEDAELWCRAFYCGELTKENVVGIDEPLYFCCEQSEISINKILNAHKSLRKILRNYGPVTLGKRRTKYELTRSYFRTGILKYTASIGILRYMTSYMRNEKISDLQIKKRAQSEIEKIMNTKIPGYD